MLVPKTLIYSQLRNATKTAGLTSMTNLSLESRFPSFRDSLEHANPTFSYRLRREKLWYHLGLQREKEQKADQQRPLH